MIESRSRSAANWLQCRSNDLMPGRNVLDISAMGPRTSQSSRNQSGKPTITCMRLARSMAMRPFRSIPFFGRVRLRICRYVPPCGARKYTSLNQLGQLLENFCTNLLGLSNKSHTHTLMQSKLDKQYFLQSELIASSIVGLIFVSFHRLRSTECQIPGLQLIPGQPGNCILSSR